MGKVNLLVKYCLINEKNEYNIKGILVNDVIKYLDRENMMFLYLKENKLKRETKESEIVFDFNEGICCIKNKQDNNLINFKIIVQELKNDNNNFYVKYKIVEDEEFEIFISFQAI